MQNEIDFTVSAPGRVFLFGEHSDYLGLEVISAALDKRINWPHYLPEGSFYSILQMEENAYPHVVFEYLDDLGDS